MTNVLSIDQGTSGTKAVVVGSAGTLLSVSEAPVRPKYLSGGGVEQDPMELLESVLLAGRSAISQAGVEVGIVAFANQGETVLAWDPTTGEPLSPMIVWQDRRSEPVCTALLDHKDYIERRTGLVLDPYFSAPKMTWLRNNVTREGVVTTSDAWILHRLTGEFVTDVATSSRSLLVDLDTGSWDPELLRLFGLEGEALPRILDNDEVAGSTTAFGQRMLVGGLIVDQQAALVAQHCLDAGEAKCTFGTGAFLLANAGQAGIRSRAGLSASAAWTLKGHRRFCLDGQIYTAASAVRWLERLAFIDSAADLDRVAAPDSEGVFCVPAFAGLAAPWWRPEATATLTGMTLSTDRGHMVRAVLEGIAAQVAELARCMAIDLGAPIKRLRVDGGLSRSLVLMQSVADLMQLPVDVYPSPHATALGAAAIARVTVDPSLGIDDAILAWEPSGTFEPQWSNDRAEAFSASWRTVAAAAAP